MSLSRLSSALTGTITSIATNDSAVTCEGITLSLRAWSRHTGISEPTLRYRHRKGWSPAQVLGHEPAPARDRASEQSGRHDTKVIILDGTDIISRRVAAAILKIEPQSLRRRLRQYRHRGEVTLTELKQSSRKL